MVRFVPVILQPVALSVVLFAPAVLAQGHETSLTEAALPAITVSKVTPRTLRDRVIASGLVAAIEEVQVQPLVEGQAIDVLLADVADRRNHLAASTRAEHAPFHGKLAALPQCLT